MILRDANNPSIGVNISKRGQTPSGNAMQVQIGPGDIISNIPIIQAYDHHQIHEGETFHWDNYIGNLGSGVSYDVVFTVPNIPIPVGINPVVYCPHFRYEVNTNDVCTLFFYESPTVTGGTGTLRTPINYERNGIYTPKLIVLDAPTITAVGTQIDAEYFLSASTNQVSASNKGGNVQEFVLRNNTSYLFRVTSGAAGCDIHCDFLWYEDLGV